MQSIPKESNVSIDFLNDYIGSHFSTEMTILNIKKELIKLSKLLEESGIKVTTEFCEGLCRESELFSSCIDKIVSNDGFTQSAIDSIMKKERKGRVETFIKGFLEYCYLNDFSTPPTSSSKIIRNEYRSIEKMKDFDISNLIQEYQSGSLSSKNDIVLQCLRLIMHCASKFENYNASFEDLTQEGILGLFCRIDNIIDNYDESKGCSFSTYTYKAIYWSICNYIERNGHTINTCGHSTLIRNMKNMIETLEEEGKSPTLLDLCELLGINKKEALSILNWCNPIESLDALLEENPQLAESSISLYGASTDFEDDVILAYSNQSLVELLKENLTPREFDIVLQRAGYFGKQVTLDELASKYNVSIQAIAQKEKRALIKIKSLKEIGEYSYLSQEPDKFCEDTKNFRKLSPEAKKLELLSFSKRMN